MELMIEVIMRVGEVLGPNAYLVGGCVRDFHLGIEPHDYDVTTPLTPEQVTERATAAGYQVVETGLKHGTVTLLGRSNNEFNVEVTTFRTDVATDGRHAQIQYAETLEEDLSRRDFTINAMAMDMYGNTIDPFGGKTDLAARILRTVGNPYDRFREDYLRVVRGLRFANKFGLNVDMPTLDAMLTYGDQVHNYVSVERIVDEFNKAFQGKRAGWFVLQTYNFGILQELLPELNGCQVLEQHPEYHPEGNVLNHICKVVENAPPAYRWHALLHDIGKPSTATMDFWNEGPNRERVFYHFYGHAEVGADMIRGIGERLKLPTKLIDSIEATTRFHMMPLDIFRGNPTAPPARAVRRFQARCGEYLKAVEAVVRADRSGRLGPSDEWLDELFTPVDQNEIKPALMGRDLIARGFEPGPLIGSMLGVALEYQLEYGVTDVQTLYEVAYAKVVRGSSITVTT